MLMTKGQRHWINMQATGAQSLINNVYGHSNEDNI